MSHSREMAFSLRNKFNFLQERYKPLTGIRAVAAIMVFLYHNRKYWRGWLPDFVVQNLNEYHTGVTLFFVLSGFLIAYTYQEKPLASTKEYCKYLAIRFFRIFPVYLLILTVSYLDGGFPKINLGIYNYTLLKGLSDKYNLEGIPQSWTLTVELCFYTIAPFLYRKAKQGIVKAALFLLCLTMLALIIGYTWHAINGNEERWLYNWLFIFNGTFFGRFIEFYTGLLLALYLRKQAPAAVNTTTYLTVMSSWMILLTVYGISCFETNTYDQGTEHIPGLLIRNAVLPVFICFFLYSLITEITWLSKILSTRLMVLLGNASYVFYLIHIGYVNRKISGIHLFPDRNFILLWLIAITIYLLIEKPVYNLARKWVNK